MNDHNRSILAEVSRLAGIPAAALTYLDDVQKALVWAIREARATLAISGPHIDLENPAKHFYQVWLSEDEHVRLCGDMLPRGFSYLMEANEGYAQDIVLNVLAKLPSDSPIGAFIAGLVTDYRDQIGRPKTVKVLPTSKKTCFRVSQDGAEIGKVFYFPDSDFSDRFLAQVQFGGCQYPQDLSNPKTSSGMWPGLEEAILAIFEAIAARKVRR